ncbi:MAG: peptide chain release factor N(5)-glutamine methyltransferase [Candidatus Saccharimonadales bacterium]
MTIRSYLNESLEKLSLALIPTARLDSLIFLEDVIGLSRAYILAHEEIEISQKHHSKLMQLISLRATHIPMAYIRGKAEFYGREFIITPAVLCPRPESEVIIDVVKQLAVTHLGQYRPDAISIFDIGTGSGILGITIALELPFADVTLLDIDNNALAVADQNCKNVGLRLPSICDDLLKLSVAHNATIDIAVANLPYIPDSYVINEAARHEPNRALFGGADGLSLYRRLFMQCRKLQVAYVITESLKFQHNSLSAIASTYSYHLESESGLVQQFTLKRK